MAGALELSGKAGQCPHKLYIRALECDPLAALAPMAAATRADAKRGGGRPVQVPSRAAWYTLDELRLRAAARTQQRQKRKASDASMDTPPKAQCNRDVARAREAVLARVFRGLESADMARQLQALCLIETEKAGCSCARRHAVSRCCEQSSVMQAHVCPKVSHGTCWFFLALGRCQWRKPSSQASGSP